MANFDAVPLEGHLVRLEPLRAEDFPELLAVSSDPEIWRYLSSRGATHEERRVYLDRLLRDAAAGSALPFTVRTLPGGRAAGLIRLKDISREHRKALVGSWFAPCAWGTGPNTESKLLVLKYAFESLACLRIEFQTDSRNQRSRAALAKMGAVEEGTLRSYLTAPDGHRRDTVVFSILAQEWPAVERNLQLRLAAQMSRGL